MIYRHRIFYQLLLVSQKYTVFTEEIGGKSQILSFHIGISLKLHSAINVTIHSLNVFLKSQNDIKQFPVEKMDLILKHFN